MQSNNIDNSATINEKVISEKVDDILEMITQARDNANNPTSYTNNNWSFVNDVIKTNYSIIPNFDDSKKNKFPIETYNNVIGIFGGRGSGKTTILANTIQELMNNNNNNNNNNIVLAPIIPERFGWADSVIGWVLEALTPVVETLKGYVCPPTSDARKFSEKHLNVDVLQKQFDELKEFCAQAFLKDAGSMLKIGLEHTGSGYELSKATSEGYKITLNFNQVISHIIKRYYYKNHYHYSDSELKEINSLDVPMVIIPIDDADLNIPEVGRMIKQLAFIATHPNIIVIMAGDYELITNALNLDLVSKATNSLNLTQFSFEAPKDLLSSISLPKNLGDDVLMKYIPTQNRIILEEPNIYDKMDFRPILNMHDSKINNSIIDLLKDIHFSYDYPNQLISLLVSDKNQDITSKISEKILKIFKDKHILSDNILSRLCQITIGDILSIENVIINLKNNITKNSGGNSFEYISIEVINDHICRYANILWSHILSLDELKKMNLDRKLFNRNDVLNELKRLNGGNKNKSYNIINNYFRLMLIIGEIKNTAAKDQYTFDEFFEELLVNSKIKTTGIFSIVRDAKIIPAIRFAEKVFNIITNNITVGSQNLDAFDILDKPIITDHSETLTNFTSLDMFITHSVSKIINDLSSLVKEVFTFVPDKSELIKSSFRDIFVKQNDVDSENKVLLPTLFIDLFPNNYRALYQLFIKFQNLTSSNNLNQDSNCEFSTIKSIWRAIISFVNNRHERDVLSNMLIWSTDKNECVIKRDFLDVILYPVLRARKKLYKESIYTQNYQKERDVKVKLELCLNFIDGYYPEVLRPLGNPGIFREDENQWKYKEFINPLLASSESNNILGRGARRNFSSSQFVSIVLFSTIFSQYYYGNKDDSSALTPYWKYSGWNLPVAVKFNGQQTSNHFWSIPNHDSYLDYMVYIDNWNNIVLNAERSYVGNDYKLSISQLLYYHLKLVADVQSRSKLTYSVLQSDSIDLEATANLKHYEELFARFIYLVVKEIACLKISSKNSDHRIHYYHQLRSELFLKWFIGSFPLHFLLLGDRYTPENKEIKIEIAKMGYSCWVEGLSLIKLANIPMFQDPKAIAELELSQIKEKSIDNILSVYEQFKRGSAVTTSEKLREKSSTNNRTDFIATREEAENKIEIKMYNYLLDNVYNRVNYCQERDCYKFDSQIMDFSLNEIK